MYTAGMVEEWKPIPGYEGFYEASDNGHIRSLARLGTPGKVLSPSPVARGGYLRATLFVGGKKTRPLVHSLIAATWHGPRPDGMVCRHLNGTPSDNRACNLAWGTPSENSADMVAHGRSPNLLKTHCPQGHPYNSANTYRWGNRRYCRACNLVRTQRPARRERAALRD